MVVGDRLWLFSQTPNVNHPQPMLTSNDAPTAFRTFGPGQSMPPTNAAMPPMQTTRLPIFPNRPTQCNFMGNTEHSTTNYEFNKPETFYRQFLSTQNAPNKYNKDYLNTVDNYFPPNHSKVLFNKLLWSNAFTSKPMEKPYDRLSFEAFGNGPSEADSHSDSGTTKAGSIAELERVFGPNADQRSNHTLVNNETKFNTKPNFSKFNGAQDNSDCLSDENSDVDCEQL